MIDQQKEILTFSNAEYLFFIVFSGERHKKPREIDYGLLTCAEIEAACESK